MSSRDLRSLIDATPWVDTHEHLVEERQRLRSGGYTFPELMTGGSLTIPSSWTALLVDYSLQDLASAGMPRSAIAELTREERSPVEQWDAAAEYLQAARATGYLRAVDLTTERLFGMRLSRETCEAVDARLRALRVEGYYAHVLCDVSNVARAQVHSIECDPFCETQTPELLQQDLALVPLAMGRHAPAEQASGIEVGSLDDYLAVLEWCFERYAARAVAAKCVWAYLRPLAVDVPDVPPRREFLRLREGIADLRERRRVEDFLFQRCVDLATAAGLPVKLHLGYLAANGDRRLRHVYDHVRDVTPIVQANPRTTFVLMHMAWPQQEQLLALAKHQPNVVVDLCWAWILAPLATEDFVQRFLTCVPATKLLCFGGDYLVVENVVGHAEIARRGLQAALERLVARGWLTSDAALALVPLLMHGNAERIFPPRLADGSEPLDAK